MAVRVRTPNTSSLHISSHSNRAKARLPLRGPAFVGLFLGLWACGADSTGVLKVDESGEVAAGIPSGGAITQVSGQGQSAPAGSSLDHPLVVKVVDGLGRPMPQVSLRWTVLEGDGSVSPSSVLTDRSGSASHIGWILGKVAGRNQISVGAEGIAGVVFTAAGIPGDPDTIRVFPPELAIHLEGVDSLTAELRDQYGNPVDALVEWSSQDPMVAEVDGAGRVRATGLGSTWVRGQIAETSDSAIVTILPNPPEILLIRSGDGQEGPAGEELANPLEVEVQDQYGHGVSGVEVRWLISAGQGVVEATRDTTDLEGHAVAKWALGPTVGSNRAQAVVDGLVPVSFGALALPGPAHELVIDPDTAQLIVGGSTSVVAEAYDRHGNPSEVDLIWSSSDQGVATVDGAGLVTAKSPGVATVTVVAGTVEAGILVIVQSVPAPETIHDLQVADVGETFVSLRWTQVKDGRGKPAFYAVRSGPPPLDWASSGASETRVGGSAVGATREYRRSDLEPSTSVEFGVAACRTEPSGDRICGSPSTVIAETSAPSVNEGGDVEASPSRITLAALGETAQLSVKVTGADGSTVSNPTLAFASLDPDVASVSSRGLITALSPGTGHVEVASALVGSADTVQVGVRQVPSSVRINPSSVSLTVGESKRLGVKVKDRNGYVIPGAAVHWTSSAPDVVAVDGSGYVNAVGAGEATIVARSEGAEGSARVLVEDASQPPQEAIGLFFYDGFESGDLKRTQNGASWGSKARVSPVAEYPSRGDRAARFNFGPDGDNEDSMAELRFNAGRRLSEVWFEADVRVPSNYQTRRPSDGATNDKLFVMWHDGRYPGGGAQTSFSLNLYPSPTGPGYGSMALFWADTEHVMKSSWAVWARDFITPSDHGKYVRLRIHAKLGVGGGTASKGDPRVGSGVIEVWWGGSKVIDEHALSWDPSEKPFLQKGYLMGWSNMGYQDRTSWYWDEIRFYDSDPGW